MGQILAFAFVGLEVERKMVVIHVTWGDETIVRKNGFRLWAMMAILGPDRMRQVPVAGRNRRSD